MIDGHCHLDGKIGDCQKAMDVLYAEAQSSGMKGLILLNLPELAYDNITALKLSQKYQGFFKVFPSVRVDDPKALDTLEHLKSLGARGLKLHPRLEGYRADDRRCIRLVQKAGDLQLPVMMDCFPDGKNLLLGNVPEIFCRLAEESPQTRIAMGHSGGHRILDALMVAKYYKNIYLDLSYTLLYYRQSNVMKDIAYAIGSIRAERIFWGSDYPDRAYADTVKLSLEEFGKMNLSPSAERAICEENVKSFLGEGA